MTTVKNHASSSRLLLLALPVSLLVLLYLLAHSSLLFNQSNHLAIGITLDLLITTPLLYFLTIRKTSIPNYTVISVVIACLLLGNIILPLEHRELLNSIRFWVIPGLELGVFTFLAIKVRSVIISFRNKDKHFDFYDGLMLAAQEAFPAKIGQLLATEVAVIYYGLVKWRNKPLTDHSYSYHKNSGVNLVIYVLIFLIAAETFALHFALMAWNETVAWAFSLLSVYTCLQVFALLKSMPSRPIRIVAKEGKVTFNHGFFSYTSIPFSDIASIEKTSRTPMDVDLVKLSQLGMLDTHNLIVHTKKPHTLIGFYGTQKRYTALAIYVDDRDQFVHTLSSFI